MPTYTVFAEEGLLKLAVAAALLPCLDVASGTPAAGGGQAVAEAPDLAEELEVGRDGPGLHCLQHAGVGEWVG